MFTRSKLKDFALFKFVAKLFRGKRRKSKSESPWLDSLDSRLAKYDESLMQPTTYGIDTTTAATDAEDQLRKLCSEVQDELNETRLVVRKERRHVDTTSVDIKAWWGGAVATWDPIDIKNLDSINQQRRPRKAKWFDNQPGSDLGRPK